MLKRYCDLCGEQITDRYMLFYTEQKKEYEFSDGFKAGECVRLRAEMCQTCYEKFYDMFKRLEREIKKKQS